MKIRAHAESHVVELDDGSQWQIFPGDLATTLSWKPETDLHLERSGERGETWPDGEVKKVLKGGWGAPATGRISPILSLSLYGRFASVCAQCVNAGAVRHHPRQSLAVRRRVVRRHPDDPRGELWARYSRRRRSQ